MCENWEAIDADARRFGGHDRCQILAGPIQSLGEVAFQRGAQLLNEAAALLDEVAAMLAQQSQLAGGGVIGHPGAELVAVFDEQFPDQAGVDRVGFGAAGGKGIAVALGGGGIDGVEHQKLILHQCVQQRAAGLFQADGDGAAAEAAPQPRDKLGEGLGRVRDLGLFRHGRIGRAQADRVFLVGPVDADDGGNGGTTPGVNYLGTADNRALTGNSPFTLTFHRRIL